MRPLVILALVLAPIAGRAAAPLPLDTVLSRVRSAVRPPDAMDTMRRVYATDRWFTFPKFHETAGYLKSAMTAAKLESVEIVRPPADGSTQFGFWTMPLAWDVRRARLEVLDPKTPAEFRILADYEKVPASLGMWSGATPPGGIEADLVELTTDRPAEIEKLDLRGKLVLTRRNPAGFKWLLAKKGALGAVNAFTENPALENGRQWINSWGDHGWGYLKDSTPLLCFSITPRQADWLRKRLAGGGAVRVRAVVDSRHYQDSYPYVTGVVRGAGPEEVLTLGHTAEQGAHDNATGVAAMLEALASLQRLIDSGSLPRPRRSIRMLAMGELYGSMHYIAANPERIRRTVAALCLDTPAAPYEMPGTEYTFYLNPHSASSYVDAFVLRVARDYFGSIGRPWHWKEYMSGTDSFLGEPTIGVPTVWPYSGSGVHTHHNSEDTPDRVDQRSLRDLAVTTAAYLYYLAAAGPDEARWLAEVAAERGLERLQAAAAASGATRDKVAYVAERQQQAVRSVERLAGGVRVAAQLERLRKESARLSAGLPAAAPPSDPQLKEAARMVVRRKRFGTLPLDDLPVEKREGYPSGAWSATPIAALYWCDGRRTLAEVIRLTRLELGEVKFNFTGYFKFLARHGYVELSEP
jgi:hypothetical protein